MVQSGTKWYRVLQSGAEFVVQRGAESEALAQQWYSTVATSVQQRCSSGTAAGGGNTSKNSSSSSSSSTSSRRQ